MASTGRTWLLPAVFDLAAWLMMVSCMSLKPEGEGNHIHREIGVPKVFVVPVRDKMS
jgi:hypothetical protein